jgi:hypothetical protein
VWAMGRPFARRRSWPQQRARVLSVTGSGLRYTQKRMLWFTIFFLVILKIPAAYLGYVIWWAVKDPPEPGTDPAYDRESPGGEDGGSPVWHPSGKRWVPGRHPGPHGSPERRPRPALAPTRAEQR